MFLFRKTSIYLLQRSEFEELCEDLDCIGLYMPNSHPIFNPIERLWRGIKEKYRRLRGRKGMKSLKEIILAHLNSGPKNLDTHVNRWYQRSLRYRNFFVKYPTCTYPPSECKIRSNEYNCLDHLDVSTAAVCSLLGNSKCRHLNYAHWLNTARSLLTNLKTKRTLLDALDHPVIVQCHSIDKKQSFFAQQARQSKPRKAKQPPQKTSQIGKTNAKSLNPKKRKNSLKKSFGQSPKKKLNQSTKSNKKSKKSIPGHLPSPLSDKRSYFIYFFFFVCVHKFDLLICFFISFSTEMCCICSKINKRMLRTCHHCRKRFHVRCRGISSFKARRWTRFYCVACWKLLWVPDLDLYYKSLAQLVNKVMLGSDILEAAQRLLKKQYPGTYIAFYIIMYHLLVIGVMTLSSNSFQVII